MGDVQAGARPVFDFDGSLDVAARMYELAATLETMGKTRHDEWRTALDAWEGNVGDHVRELIRPALAEGRIVLCDRYYLSTVAYQGARGLDAAAILRKSEAEFPVPDVVLLLEIDPAAGL